MKKFFLFGFLSFLFPRTLAAQPFQEMTYTPEKTLFALFAPNDAKKVTLRIYEYGLGGKALKTVSMKRTADEQWTATVKGALRFLGGLHPLCGMGETS